MAVSERAACLINKYAIRSQEECSPSATEPGEATGAQRPRLLPLRDVCAHNHLCSDAGMLLLLAVL